MRIESSVTAVSWVPAAASRGASGSQFHVGAAQYDDPPPDQLDDLPGAAGRRAGPPGQPAAGLRRGRATAASSPHGQSGQGHVGTTRRVGPGSGGRGASPPGRGSRRWPCPTCDPNRRWGTAGCGSARPPAGCCRWACPTSPTPAGSPRLAAPAAWTTLALTIHADGTSEQALVGASPFPRHWVYDHAGRLIATSGVVDFSGWQADAWDPFTPWGGRDAPVRATAVETALERELSRVMLDSAPHWLRLRKGATLVAQGDPGHELYLLFDGLLAVEIDGVTVTELGPGAVVGELALLDGGPAHRHPAGRHRLPGRGRARRPDRPDRPGRAGPHPRLAGAGRRRGRGVTVCPVCGEPNPARASFCLNCGSQLPAAGAASRPARKTVTVVFTDLAGSARSASGSTRSRWPWSWPAGSTTCGGCSSATAAGCRSSSATRWWPCSASRWSTRTTPCGRSGPRPTSAPASGRSTTSWNATGGCGWRSAPGSTPARWSPATRPSATPWSSATPSTWPPGSSRSPPPARCCSASRPTAWSGTRSRPSGSRRCCSRARAPRSSPTGWARSTRAPPGTPAARTPRSSVASPSCACSPGCTSGSSAPPAATC